VYTNHERGNNDQGDAGHVASQRQFIPPLADWPQQVECRRRAHAVLRDQQIRTRNDAVVVGKLTEQQVANKKEHEDEQPA
jgi:hypothetical protein